MRPDLRKELIRILEELASGNWQATIPSGHSRMLTIEAVNLLEANGSIWEKGNLYIITADGYDYHKKLKSPRWYWIKKNWFPVAVLLVTLGANLFVTLLD